LSHLSAAAQKWQLQQAVFIKEFNQLRGDGQPESDSHGQGSAALVPVLKVIANQGGSSDGEEGRPVSTTQSFQKAKNEIFAWL